ncbi:UNVERIFIED_CONTAM: RimJ/RimL family protein N-acetyltransferase [Streptomyces canus]
MIAPIPPVVPAGRMADNTQPALALPGGLELRPWRTPLPALTEDEARAYRADAGAVEEGDGGGVGGCVGGRGRRGGRPDKHRHRPRRLDRRRPRPGPRRDRLLGAARRPRGTGIAVEAARRLTDWALHDLGLHRLTLCHAVADDASCRVAEKAGFRLEGTMRHALLHFDGRHDQHLHARVRGDDQNDRDDRDHRGNERP